MTDTATKIDLTLHRKGLDALTDQERRCMLLVAQGYNSKEIGLLLGVSPNRVDKLVFSVRRLLGNAGRFEIARLVASDVAAAGGLDDIGQRLGAQSLPLSPPSQLGSDGPADDETKAEVWHGHALAEEQGIYTLSDGASALLGLMPIRSGRRSSNDLSTLHIMAIFVVLVMAAVITAGSAATFLTSLDSVVRR